MIGAHSPTAPFVAAPVMGLPASGARTILIAMSDLRALSEDSDPSHHARLAKAVARVSFSRKELNQILSVYGRFVGTGEWRDYAIDSLADAAVFSIYRRASEAPLYRVEKQPLLARRQGAYAVISMAGYTLKRGRDLAAVLRLFDRKRMKIVA